MFVNNQIKNNTNFIYMSESLSSIKSSDTKQLTLDNPPIYKVKHIVNGLIHTIYIFYGKKPMENEEEIFNKIFTDKENYKKDC